jgi:hypothetical protein
VADLITVSINILDVYLIDEGKMTMRLMISETWQDLRLKFASGYDAASENKV